MTDTSQSGELVHVLEGHSDFVKSTAVLPTLPPLLVSASSDKSFRLWDLSPLETKAIPVSRQVVKEHTRPVDAAVFAVSDDNKEPTVSMWTADSMGVMKEWKIPQVRESLPSPHAYGRRFWTTSRCFPLFKTCLHTKLASPGWLEWKTACGVVG